VDAGHDGGGGVNGAHPAKDAVLQLGEPLQQWRRPPPWELTCPGGGSRSSSNSNRQAPPTRAAAAGQGSSRRRPRASGSSASREQRQAAAAVSSLTSPLPSLAPLGLTALLPTTIMSTFRAAPSSTGLPYLATPAEVHASLSAPALGRSAARSRVPGAWGKVHSESWGGGHG
jgi:hypothetical protein